MALVSSCVDSLKKLPRTGWMQRGVPPSIAETVSAHSFESSIISALIADKVGADVEKSISMAIMHDIAECLVGDLPLFTSSRIGNLKEELEKEAVASIGLPKSLISLYQEWITQETREARIVKVAEKLATLFEAKRLRSMGIERVREIEDSVNKQIMELLDNPSYAFLRDAVKEIASYEGVSL